MNYLPEAKNDSIFAFVGDKDVIILIAFGTIFTALTVFIILRALKKRKDGKK